MPPKIKTTIKKTVTVTKTTTETKKQTMKESKDNLNSDKGKVVLRLMDGTPVYSKPDNTTKPLAIRF